MKAVSAFVLWWSRANLSIILWSYQANFSSLASSYTRILHHQGSKLRKPGWETGRYPYASCQSWRKRNWHTPWDLLGCTYFDSIWACVSHAAAGHDNHQVGFAQRHLLFCLIMHLNESFNFQKMFGSFFYFTTAKFALYQSIASIVKMKHQVGFQSVAVTIVWHMIAKTWSINPKVSCTHLLNDNNSYCNRCLIMYAKLVIFSYICKLKLIFVDV